MKPKITKRVNPPQIEKIIYKLKQVKIINKIPYPLKKFAVKYIEL